MTQASSGAIAEWYDRSLLERPVYSEVILLHVTFFGWYRLLECLAERRETISLGEAGIA